MIEYQDLHAHVSQLLDKHISRDRSLVAADLDWERDNFVRSLAAELRRGLPDKIEVSDEPGPPPVPDYSEFEGS